MAPSEESPLISSSSDSEHGSDRTSWDWRRLLATGKQVFMGSGGMLADGYDLMVINLVLAIMSHVHPEQMTSGARGLAASCTLAGVIVGQLSFGVIADIIGRKTASISTAALTVVGAGTSALVMVRPGFGIAGQLALCRFVLGLGIGGEYPLSAAISQEVGKSKDFLLSRSQLLCINIGMFNVGGIIQAALVWIMMSAGVAMHVVWRVALAGGMLPSLLAIFFRMQMHEPETSPDSARGMVTGRAEDLQSYAANLRTVIGPNWRVLLGAMASWFVFNWTAYGQGSFASSICDSMFSHGKEDPRLLVQRDAAFSLLMSFVCLVGSFSGLLIEAKISRRTLQLIGFVTLSVTMWLLSFLFGNLSHHLDWLLLAILIVANMSQAILGLSTYLVPTENFPARSRGTVVGIAAASGKLGGFLGTLTFPFIEAARSLNVVLMTSGITSIVGILVTLYLTPTRSGAVKEEQFHKRQASDAL